MNLQGKVAVVTGASAGIGRAYALALAGEGATVVAAARRLGGSEGEAPDANSLATLVTASKMLSGRIYAQACDVELEADIVRLVEQTVASFGRIDVLVNNAAALRLDVKTRRRHVLCWGRRVAPQPARTMGGGSCDLVEPDPAALSR